MYPHLDYARFTETTLNIDNSVAQLVLANSKGQPTMSDIDMKLAIVSLFHTCKRQQVIIDELVTYVNDSRQPKKPFWHRLKK